MIGNSNNVAIGVVSQTQSVVGAVSDTTTQIIQVGKINTSNYNYLVTFVRWQLLGVNRSKNFNQTISLDPANTQDRIDRIVLNTETEIIYAKKGTPSATPSAEPNTLDELKLFDVNVNANTTSANVTRTLVWAENTQQAGGEYNTTIFGNGIDADNTEDVISGTKSIAFATDEKDSISFASQNPNSVADFDALVFDIRLLKPLQQQLRVYFGTNTEVTDLIELQNNQYGFNANTVNQVQTIIIPLANLRATSFNTIGIANASNNANYLIDNINLVTDADSEDVDVNVCCTSEGGGGQSSPVLKTGTNIEHTEDAYYNRDAPLTTGSITLNNANAVLGVGVINHVDRYVPQIISPNIPYVIEGDFDNTKLHEVLSIYKGDRFVVRVSQFSYLATPFITVTPSSGQLQIAFGVLNATNYTVLVNTVNDKDTATAVPNYNGTDTSYTYTGLTNGQEYFFFVTASANGQGFLDSDIATRNAIPLAPNTLIGGKGLTLNSASSLASFLSIDESNITNFAVGGNNDISCDINIDYAIPTNSFQNDTEITSYKDKDGRCTNTGGEQGFRGCSNLVEVEFNGSFTATPFFFDCPLLEKITTPNNTFGVYGRNCDSIKFINSPLATFIPPFAFFGTDAEISLLLPLVTSIGGSAFHTNNSKIILETPLVTSITNASSLQFLTNPQNKFILEGATSFGDGGFMARRIRGRVVLNGLTNDIGGTPANTNCFQGGDANKTIYANNYLATNNSGSIDGDLQTVINEGGTVVFNTNPVTPPNILDLSVSNITTNSANLNFTAPTTQNTYSHLDVYLDTGEGAGYRLLDEVVNSGDTISNLISGNEIRVKVKTIDEFYNRSVFSNEITFTAL